MQIQHDLEVMDKQDEVRPSNMKPIDFQPLPLELRQRNKDCPSGLKNIGNGKTIFILYFSFIVCYFSSLIQVFFFLPNFQEKIMNFNSNNIDSNFTF